MKNLQKLLLSIILPCMIFFSACSIEDLQTNLNGNTTDISDTKIAESLKGADGKDGINGLNGLNGKNGKDGDNIDLFEVYTKLIELNQFNGTYAEFVKEYLNTDENIYSTSNALRCSVSVFSGFKATLVYSDMYGTRNTFVSKYYSSGSGVIYSLDSENGDALIITNYHVVYDHSSDTKISDEINILLYGNNKYSVSTKEYVVDYRSYTKYEYKEFTSHYSISATYLGGSMEYDLAVLKISGSDLLKNNNLIEAKFANSNELTVGETAIAVGNASSLGISATVGCVSVDSEYIKMIGVDNSTTCTFRVIRTDSAVNPGNSGGGLFNSKGELIGIVNAKKTTNQIENIGYAIPSNLVEYVVQNIIKNCDGVNNTSVKRCLFGIKIVSGSSSLVYNPGTLKTSIIETVVVSYIEETSIAYGKLAEGEILTSVHIEYLDGRELNLNLTRTFQLIDLTLSLSVGDKVTFYRTTTDGTSLEPTTVTMTQESISICK